MAGPATTCGFICEVLKGVTKRSVSVRTMNCVPFTTLVKMINVRFKA